MAVCVVDPGLLSGRLSVPPSKSMAHRALFCAALAEGNSRIDNITPSDDILATMAALQALGVSSVMNPSSRFKGRMLATIHGTGTLSPTGDAIDCHESGSTARFIIPVSRLVQDKVTVTGRARLLERPFGLFSSLFAGKGVSVADRGGRLPLTLQGKLEPGIFRLRGDVSSQFVTGLLFVLPMLAQDSVIEIDGLLESAPYVSMTIEMLALHGVRALMENGASIGQVPGHAGKGADARSDDTGTRILVPGRQHYRPVDHDVEGDWSQAAFWAVAGALGGQVALDGLRMDSLQGDRAVVDILRAMGADIRVEGGSLHIGGTGHVLRAVDMDVSQCPDLVPALAVAAVHADGVSRIFNAARLRIKESDRLQAMREQLGILGARITEEPDGLVIDGLGHVASEVKGSMERQIPGQQGRPGLQGRPVLQGRPCAGQLSGGSVNGCGDHRIVMASAIAATCAGGGVAIEGMEAVGKSYPGFWDDFRQMGGNAHEQHVG